MIILSFEQFINENEKKEWSESEIRDEAKKYKNRKEFRETKGKRKMYLFAKSKFDNILKEIYGEIDWTEDLVRDEAKKYKNKEELRLNCRKAFKFAKEHDMFKELFPDVREYKHWNDELVLEEASKYDTRTEFHDFSHGAYEYAIRNKLIDSFEWLIPNGDNRPRSVYLYKDDDNKVAYVGLTVNKIERHKTHKTGLYKGLISESSVYKYFNSINKDVPEPIYLKDNLSQNESQKMEDYYKNKFESEGYLMLNKGKTGEGIGSLGRNYKWTDELIKAEASKYVNSTEFKNNSRGAWNKANEKGMLIDLYPNGVHRKKTN